MLITNKIDFLRKYAANSFSFDWEDDDNIALVNSIVGDAVSAINTYLGYPLELSEINQLLEFPSDHVFLASPAIIEYMGDAEIAFQRNGFIKFTSHVDGVINYKAGYTEETLPQDIKGVIARISLIYLQQYINNTIANKSISKNIGGQTAEVTSIDANAIKKQVEKLHDYKSYNVYGIYNSSVIISEPEPDPITLGCGAEFSLTNTGAGIYDMPIQLGTETGWFEIELDAFGVPDRFQILYEENDDERVIADSLFVGDNLDNSADRDKILNATKVNYYQFDGIDFLYVEKRLVDFTTDDIASYDGSETREDGSGSGQIGVIKNFPDPIDPASRGSLKLRFKRESTDPATAILRVTGFVGTGWRVVDVTCPSADTIPEPFTCADTLTYTGDSGIYRIDTEVGEATGNIELDFTATDKTSRIKAYLDDTLVADSLFIGTYDPAQIEAIASLKTNVLIDKVWEDRTPQDVTFTAADLAVSDGSETRADGSGTGQLGVVAEYPTAQSLASHKDIKLSFNKPTAEPQSFRIEIWVAEDETSWSLNNISCPSV